MPPLNSITTRLNGMGIDYTDIIHKVSPILGMLFYDPESLAGVSDVSSLKPKMIEKADVILSDGRTVRWSDVDLRPQNSIRTAGGTTGTATVTVADGTLYNPGESVFIQATGETYVISSIATNVLTFTVNIVTTIPASSPIYKVGYSIGLGGNGSTVSTQASAEQTNLIQDISHRIVFDQDKLNTFYEYHSRNGVKDDAIVNSFVQFETRRAKSEILNDIARTFYVGTKSTVTIGGENRNYAGGFRDFYTQVTDCTGTDANTAWDNIISALTPYQEIDAGTGTSGVFLVCTPSAAQAIDNLLRKTGSLQEPQSTDYLGTNITRIKTAIGDVNIISDPILRFVEGNANVAYALNPGLVKMVSTPRQMTVFDVNQKQLAAKKQEGILLHVKPQQNANSIEVEAFSNFSFVFAGNTVNAGGRLTNLGVF